MSKVSGWCTSIITYTFAALFFFVPLVLWPKNSELFEFNKMMLVYILAIVIGATWVVKWVADRKVQIKRTPLDIPILLFFIGQTLATIFSIDPHTSVWGYYSRFHGGLASTIAYIVLYYALVTNISEKDAQSNHLTNDSLFSKINEKLRIYIWSILSSAVLVSVYGILEHFGIDKTVWIQDVQNRVFSTLGQPNWLSAYLIAILPLPLYLTWQKSKNGYWPWITSGMAFLFILTILYTKSRSGIGAMGIMFVLIFVSILFFIRAKVLETKINNPIRKLITVFAIAAGILFLTGTPWTPNPMQIQERLNLGGPLWPEAEKYLNKFHLSTQVKPVDLNKLSAQDKQFVELREKGVRVGGSDSGEIRDIVWRGALDLYRRYPLFGTGVETFGYSYYWARPVAHNMLSEWDFLYNKAHNEYLNFLATTGTVGFTTYLILVFGILFLLIANTRRDPEHRLIHWSLLVGFISILITNYFGFSVVAVALFFFLFPALSFGLTSEASDGKLFSLGVTQRLSKKEQKMLDKGKLHQNLTWWQYSLMGVSVLAAGYGIYVIGSHWQADVNYASGRAYDQAGYVGQAIPQLEAAHKLYPGEPTFTAELAESYANAALAVQQQFEALPATRSALLKDQAFTTRDAYAKKAIDKINEAVGANKYNLNFLKSEAKVYLTLGTYDRSNLTKVQETLFQANALAPTDAKIIYNIGLVYMQLNQPDKAKIAFQKALELKPDYDSAKQQLDQIAALQKKTGVK